MSDCGCHSPKIERKTLVILLLINAVMFVIEILAGILSDSTALMADSLDMFADASVYALSLYAVGKPTYHKKRAAMLSGILQVALVIPLVIDVIGRFIGGSLPESGLMIVISLLALIANSYGLFLLSKYRGGEIHVRASWIFTQNDVIANFSVIIAGLLVHLFGSPLPDLIVGFGIGVLVLRGGYAIICDSLHKS